MKSLKFILVFTLVLAFLGCKKDEGLNDSDHKQKFIKSYGTLSEGVDIAQTADGGFILFGTIQGASSIDLYLKKVDGFGNDQWSKTYDGPLGGFDEIAAAVKILDNGGYILLGTTTDTIPGAYIRSSYLIQTDYLGNVVNKSTYNSGVSAPKIENEQAYGISVIQSGNEIGNFLIVSEKSVTRTGGGVFSVGIVRGIENGSLNLLFINTLATISGSGFNIGPRDILITSNLEVVVTGFVDKTGSNGVLIAVYNEKGNGFVNFPSYGGAGNDLGHAIIENSKGEVVVAGYTTQGTKQLYVLNSIEYIGFTPSVQWSFTGKNSGENEAFDIVEMTDGYVIAGYSELNADRQFFLVKINSTGTSVIWEKKYGFVDFDAANALIKTDDNGLAVLGTSSDERGNKVMTLLKLDAGGNLR